MDTHGFASLAHLQVLLVPVGSISLSVFERYVGEIRAFESLRLGDIPVDTKNERARFMPNPLSTGHLHLSFPTHAPPAAHGPFALIRPAHFPLAVIGLAVCGPGDTLGAILAQFHAALLELFPGDSLYPLARTCFVFEDGDGNNSSNLHETVQGLVVIPSQMGNKQLYLGTLIADLCSNVLAEFGVLVQTLESPLGNEYLNAALFPTLPPLSEMPAPLDAPSLPTHNSVPDMVSKPAFSLAGAPSLKRTSSAGPRQSTLGPPVVPRKRFSSSIGVASSHGRLFKLLGDFYMIAGRTDDASIWYGEALQMFKTSQDPVWHAATLEGLATVSILEAWASGHGLQTSTSNMATRDPWADIIDKLSQATTLYFKAPPSDADHHYTLLSYLYCCCVLRHSSLLFSVWSAKGWGPLAFASMLQPGTSPYLPPTIPRDEAPTWSMLERLSSISGVSRLSISSVLTQLHGPWLLHLGPRERIFILESMASMYSCMGFRRKEAYILREILGCILDLIVCGREEDGAPRSSVSGDNSVTPTALGDVMAKAQVGIRMNESADGNASLLGLLNYICKTLGIDLEAVKLVDVGASPVPSAEEADLEDDMRESFGWPELQVGVVREALAVAEALPDHLSVAQFALSSLKTLQDALAPGDQYHMYTTSQRALLTARRRGELKTVDFWAGNPLVSISVTPLPLIRLPNEKPISALRPKSDAINPILTGGTDPFLYNPRRALAGKQTMIVQNETLEVVVILKNPYVFDLEIDSFILSTSGPTLEAPPVRATIPARSYHRVVVSGRVTCPGLLVIRGCIIEGSGGTREFLLPLPTPDEEERTARRRGALLCEMGRSKYPGLDALPWEKSQKRRSGQFVSKAKAAAPMQFLECKVVPEQPLLRIRRTSVAHGALMLYDGERSVIRLTVENVSGMTIDFLRLLFDDSTIQPAQQALMDGSGSTFDTYETEYDLIHRPLFSWNQDEARPLKPGERLTLNVQCLGKVGCTTGTIYATYACVERGVEDAPEVFHTRQISYPLMVSVYRMLECHSMDIHPYPANGDGAAGGAFDHADWCLFSVEIRNTYGTPFEVVVERTQKDEPPSSTSSTIAPGSTSRVVIPLKKFILSETHLAEPIPTLSERQFVVATTKLSAEQDRRQRELFWYREELFKCLHCHWKEAGGTRSGDLSLRQQRITMQMLNALRTDSAKVVMTLLDGEDGEVRHEGGRAFPPPHEFVYLRIQVVNQTPSTLSMKLNITIDPLEHVLFEGVLSDIPVGRLQSGETKEVSIPVCFLSLGRFVISASVRLGGMGLSEGVKQLIALVE